MRVAVIGAGSWGTALALVLAEAGHEVVLWARTPEVARAINEEHRNPRYLSDYRLPSAIRATAEYAAACDGAEAVVIVTPSAALRSVAADLRKTHRACDPHCHLLEGRGGEDGPSLPIDTFAAELGNAGRMAVLSGPTHAEEVICRKPSAAVVASADEGTALFFRDLFATRFFRTYTSDDPVGVELCAAFKNVIAIAVGISYGMGFGDNTAAMLITRGLAEMSRMVVAAGERRSPAWGSGVPATWWSPACRSTRATGVSASSTWPQAGLPWTISRPRPTWWWKGPSPARPWPRSRPATGSICPHRHGAQRRVGRGEPARGRGRPHRSAA